MATDKIVHWFRQLNKNPHLERALREAYLADRWACDGEEYVELVTAGLLEGEPLTLTETGDLIRRLLNAATDTRKTNDPTTTPTA